MEDYGLTAVTSRQTADRLQRRFLKQLEEVETSQENARIIWRPGFVEVPVHWSKTLGMWWYSKPLENRWWNSFGLQDPSDGRALRIDCEINFPFSGIGRSVAAGVLLSYSRQHYFVGHRGNRVGGGRKGVTKELFWANWPESQSVQVLDSMPGGAYRIAQVALIGELGDDRLPAQIVSFVKFVRELKEQVAGYAPPAAGRPIRKFSPEFEGTREQVRTRSYTAIVNHGRVVNELRDTLEQLLGHGRVFNTPILDLYVGDERRIEWLLEIKTDSSRSAIYEVIGQLKYHSTEKGIPSDVGLIAVVPADMKDGDLRKIEALGIHVVRYVDRPSGIRFEGLRSLIRARQPTG